MIIHEHPLISFALRNLFIQHGYYVTQYHKNNGSLFSLIENENPDIVVIDLHVENGRGLALATDIQFHRPNIKIIALSSIITPFCYQECKSLGFMGYIDNSDSLENILLGIKAVHSGKCWYSSPPVRKKFNEINRLEASFVRHFSERELAVLKKLSCGRSNNEIANEMNLSYKTISTYKMRIIAKLNVDNFTEALDIARQHEIP